MNHNAEAVNKAVSEFLESQVSQLKGVNETNRRLYRTFRETGEHFIFGQDKGKGILWTGLSKTDQGITNLAEILTAFLGPSYLFAPVEINDQSDQIPPQLKDHFSGRTVTLSCSSSNSLNCINLLANVLGRTERLPKTQAITIRSKVRDFEMAILAGREQHARSLLRDLHGLFLSESNLKYLEIQLLGEFEKWNELVGLSGLRSIANNPRPRPVTEVLLHCLFNHFVEPHLRNGDTRTAYSVFKSQLLTQFPRLFEVRRGFESYSCRILFMFWAVAKKDHVEIETLKDTVTDDEAGLFLEIANLLGGDVKDGALSDVTPVLETGIENARRLMDDEQYERAIQSLKPSPVSIDKAKIILECAFVIRTLEVAKLGIHTVNELEDTERASLFKSKRLSRLYEEVAGQVPQENKGTDLPGDWAAWFEFLPKHEEIDLKKVALHGASEWEFSLGYTEVRTICHVLNSALEGETKNVVELSLPYLISYLERDPDFPNRNFAGIYRAILDWLAINTNGNESELDILNEMFRAVLDCGVTEFEYTELLSFLDDVWRRFCSPRCLSWRIATLEMIADYPCHDTEARAKSFLDIQATPPRYFENLDGNDLDLLEAVCEQIDLDSITEFVRSQIPERKEVPEDAIDIWSILEGKKIGIYTLTVPVAKRVQAKVSSLCPNCNVGTNHDKVSTPVLENLAESSDLFVMAIRSAQHAATDGIKRVRGERPILTPKGKGSASMMRALVEFLSGDCVSEI